MGIRKGNIAVCTAVVAVAAFFILGAPVQAQANTTSPASISDLNETAVGDTWINWTWTNPSDVNFSLVMVYDEEGVLKTNVSGMPGNMSCLNTSSIGEEPFEANTTYTICTHTVDTEGNISTTWVNDSATTLPSPEAEVEAEPELISEVEAANETEAEVAPEVEAPTETEAEATPEAEAEEVAPSEATSEAEAEATPEAEAEAPSKTPGFKTILAIASLLAVTYLVRIRK